MNSNNKELMINDTLVRRLIASQFPQWKDLLVQPVAHQGWDNRTFHLGSHMLVRLPSAVHYAAQVEKEQLWLPKLAPALPLPIPAPIAIGMPTEDYPWKWSINAFLPGDSVSISTTPITDLGAFATSLAQFLVALQRIDSTGGPMAGPHSFYRGGPLATYDTEARQAIKALGNKIDGVKATEVWEAALASTWQATPVWVHGDISTGNLLVQEGKLSAVIDFGQLAIGDPACDLAIAWTLFFGESQQIFRKLLPLDSDTWARGRGWTLWKALIVAAGQTDWNAIEARQSWRIIEEVLKY
jgi:aminoglycoside phosphotransferase (APT) family kinase protein